MGTEGIIDPYIDWTPYARADARLRGYGMHVWAIIGQLRVANGNVEEVARLYGIPREAVEAACAYYRENAEFIDARLLLNSA